MILCRLLHTSLSVCFSLRGIPTVPLLLPFFFFEKRLKIALGNSSIVSTLLLSQTSSLVRRRGRANFPAEPLFPPVSILCPKFKGHKMFHLPPAPLFQHTYTALSTPFWVAGRKLTVLSVPLHLPCSNFTLVRQPESSNACKNVWLESLLLLFLFLLIFFLFVLSSPSYHVVLLESSLNGVTTFLACTSRNK